MTRRRRRRKQSEAVDPPLFAKRSGAKPVADRQLYWRFSGGDRGGPFAWTGLSDPSDYKRVLERLFQFETMDDGAVAAAGSHFIERDSLGTEALRRLEALRLDDIDGLMSFRIGGRERVFCRRIGRAMHVLWWDPEHRVCPAPLRNT